MNRKKTIKVLTERFKDLLKLIPENKLHLVYPSIYRALEIKGLIKELDK